MLGLIAEVAGELEAIKASVEEKDKPLKENLEKFGNVL